MELQQKPSDRDTHHYLIAEIEKVQDKFDHSFSEYEGFQNL